MHYDIIRDKHTMEKILAATHARTETQTSLTIPQIVTDYADMFEGFGQLGPELQLEVNDSIKPVRTTTTMENTRITESPPESPLSRAREKWRDRESTPTNGLD